MIVRTPDQVTLHNLWLSSWVLSLSQFGDALLYIVLPVHADAFGISMVMVGFLLAVNRIVRIFAYGVIVRIGKIVGLRNLCIFAAITAAASSLGYVLATGVIGLTGARMVWGLSYAALLLVTLAYASQNKEKTGTRVGISRSVEQVGPLLALTAGAWIAGLVGPKDAFIYMAIGSMLVIPMALMITKADIPVVAPAKRMPSLGHRPSQLDLLIFWMGAGIDGVFTVSITLIWANHVSIQTAIMIGGVILAVRRFGEMLIAPLAGRIADKFGVKKPLLVSSLITVFGFAAIGMGFLITGSAALVIGRSALGTLFPTAVSLCEPERVLEAMARNMTWRDIGAAAGPIATGAAVTLFDPEWLHTGMAVIFAGFFALLLVSPTWRKLH